MTNQDASEYIGMTELDAVALAQKSDRRSRVIEKDGERFFDTTVFVSERLNFIVNDGFVTDVTLG